jgi:hypothetical protein
MVSMPGFFTFADSLAIRELGNDGARHGSGPWHFLTTSGCGGSKRSGLRKCVSISHSDVVARAFLTVPMRSIPVVVPGHGAQVWSDAPCRALRPTPCRTGFSDVSMVLATMPEPHSTDKKRRH